MQIDYQKLNKINKRIKLEKFKLKREVLNELLNSNNDRTHIGLTGSRGAGKTVLLKQLLGKIKNSFYISLDHLNPEENIYELLESLNENYGYDTFLLDEIHYIKNINKHLKLIYDNLKIKIYFSSSVSLEMYKTYHDLSRRIKLFKIPFFSFYEYLKINNIEIEKNSFEQIVKYQHYEIIQNPDLLFNYLNGGCFPASIDNSDYIVALTNIVNQVIEQDISRVSKISYDDILNIKKLLKFIAINPIEDLNATSISKNIGVSRYKTENYLNLLENAFLINQIKPTGKNVLKENKILLKPPIRLIYNTYENCIGALREDFAVESLLNINSEINYLKNQRGKKVPDYLINNKYIIEIGGPNKNKTQFKGIDESLYDLYVFKQGPPYKENLLPLEYLGLISHI